jgi:hypothetical protein
MQGVVHQPPRVATLFNSTVEHGRHALRKFLYAAFSSAQNPAPGKRG